ncbi:MAG: type II toxin-antitoxin system HicA family toxin [Candidatus Cloacimonetes bacterium]|nr:type II toxin-antitoxin system HicA family toxin [Candidatus Cloacimonadota bacterium]
MKRKDLLKYLDKNGCKFLREGKKHTVYINRKKLKSTTIPRHREINDFLAKKICKDLEIPAPK